MALVRYSAYVEIADPDETEVVLDAIGDALCGGKHDISDPSHECGREFAVLAGMVDDTEIDWKQEIHEAFAVLVPKKGQG